MIGAHGIGRRRHRLSLRDALPIFARRTAIAGCAVRGSSDRGVTRQRNGRGRRDHGGSGGRGVEDDGTGSPLTAARITARRCSYKTAGAARDTRGGRAITYRGGHGSDRNGERMIGAHLIVRIRRRASDTVFPYTTLCRSAIAGCAVRGSSDRAVTRQRNGRGRRDHGGSGGRGGDDDGTACRRAATRVTARR